MAISRRVKLATALALLLAAAFAAGCSTIGYYWQAMHGQVELTRKARPIPEVMAGLDSGSVLKARLARVVEMRDFASQELRLPDNGSYRRYADVGRPYVVWNVFAAPEFSTNRGNGAFRLPVASATRAISTRRAPKASRSDCVPTGTTCTSAASRPTRL